MKRHPVKRRALLLSLVVLVGAGPLARGQLVADFTADVVVGDNPLTVQFTDLTTSDDAVTLWHWTFGDGGSSTDQHPAHTFDYGGPYTVKLVVFTAGFEFGTEEKVDYIDVLPIDVTPAFTASATQGVGALEVSFTIQSPWPDASWTWTFGDGDDGVSGTLLEPSHVYFADSVDSFDVALEVSYHGQTGQLERPDLIQVVVGRLGPSAPTTLSTPFGLQLVDLDADGLEDVVSSAPGLRWFPGLQSGFGPEHLLYPDTAGLSNAEVGDLDGDGDPDIAFCDSSLGIQVFRNTDGLGSFDTGSVVYPSACSSLLSADLDGDGDLDLVGGLLSTFGVGEDVFWIANDGQGAFPSTPTALSPGELVGASRTKIAADIDADGDTDVFWEPWLARNLDGSGQSWSLELVEADSAEFVDLDIDGATDLLIGDGASYKLAWLSGVSGPHLEVADPTLSFVSQVRAADLDLDGDPDVVASCWDGTNWPALLWVPQSGTPGVFEEVRPIAGYQDHYSLAISDLDDDGDLDLLTQREDGCVVYPNRTIDSSWSDAGPGLASAAGEPELHALGALSPGETIGLGIAHGDQTTPVTLVLGASQVGLPFKGGTLTPFPDVLLPATLDQGARVLTATWPAGLPAGLPIYVQAWIQDASAPVGLAATRALVGVTGP